MKSIREALLSMAYVERKPKFWLKPVGYQCFYYHEDKNEWINYFLSAQDKVEIYEIKKFDLEEADFLRQLKEFEVWTKKDFWINGRSHFELFALDL